VIGDGVRSGPWPVDLLRWSPDGSYLLTADCQHHFHLWETDGCASPILICCHVLSCPHPNVFCHVMSDTVRSGQVRSGQVRSGQVRSTKVREGQVEAGQVRVSKVRSG
jgi:hypothetical protein